MKRVCRIPACLLIAVIVSPSFAEQISYDYDVLGRLSTVSYADGTVVRYQYDSAGNRTAQTLEAARFSINDASAQEGSALTFTVSRSGRVSGTQSVKYTTVDGTAKAGSDYQFKTGTLTFSPGQSSKTLTISGIEDSTLESTEYFYVDLSSPSSDAAIADGQGRGAINNDDAGPQFKINNVSSPEGNSLTFTVTKVGSTAKTHAVNYATADGSAKAGSDYLSKSGTLTFSAGQSSKTLTISGVEDGTFESNESFNVKLSSATAGATISDSEGKGTVTNDDAAPSFKINNVAASEGNSLTFTVEKTGSTALNHTVYYSTADGTARAGSDYSSRSGSIKVYAAQSSKVITISTIEDSTVEPNETFYVNLTSVTGGAVFSDNKGRGTIDNDDQPNTPPDAQNDNIRIADIYLDRIAFVLSNDTDADGDTLLITSITQSSNAQAVISGSGTSIHLLSTSTGTASLSYTVSDGNGGTDTATLTIRVDRRSAPPRSEF